MLCAIRVAAAMRSTLPATRPNALRLVDCLLRSRARWHGTIMNLTGRVCRHDDIRPRAGAVDTGNMSSKRDAMGDDKPTPTEPDTAGVGPEADSEPADTSGRTPHPKVDDSIVTFRVSQDQPLAKTRSTDSDLTGPQRWYSRRDPHWLAAPVRGTCAGLDCDDAILKGDLIFYHPKQHRAFVGSCADRAARGYQNRRDADREGDAA